MHRFVAEQKVQRLNPPQYLAQKDQVLLAENIYFDYINDIQQFHIFPKEESILIFKFQIPNPILHMQDNDISEVLTKL